MFLRSRSRLRRPPFLVLACCDDCVDDERDPWLVRDGLRNPRRHRELSSCCRASVGEGQRMMMSGFPSEDQLKIHRQNKTSFAAPVVDVKTGYHCRSREVARRYRCWSASRRKRSTCTGCRDLRLEVHVEGSYGILLLQSQRGRKEMPKDGTSSKQWLLWEYKDKDAAINGVIKMGTRRRTERPVGSLISLDRRLGFTRSPR